MKHRTAIAMLLALAACAPQAAQHPQQQAAPQQKDFLQELADRPVTCCGKDECNAKWNRAIEWVTKHTNTGIKNISAHAIVTRSVADGSIPPLHYAEFSVVRYAKGGGMTFEFRSYCDYGFLCNPTGMKLKASFVTFVMGPPPGVKVSDDGNSATKTIQH